MASKNFSKIIIGAAFAVLLMLVVSQFGNNNTLTGLPVAGASSLPGSYENLTLTPRILTGAVYNSTGQIITSSFLTLQIVSSKPNAWRFVENGRTKNVNTIEVVLKNATASDPAQRLVGAVLYYNGTRYVQARGSTDVIYGRDLVTTLPPMYYNDTIGILDRAVRIKVELKNVISTSRRYGRVTQVKIQIPEIINATSIAPGGFWNEYFVLASPSAMNGNFRNSLTSTSTSAVEYVNSAGGVIYRGVPPYTSPRGSIQSWVSPTSVGIVYSTRLRR
ncbi:MAG: hypothetical protein V1644_02155 [Candidatus Micrarchaeota archaeon]